MSQNLNQSILRIFSPASQVVGAGFLAAPGIALTCAHVVCDALGLPRDQDQPPAGELFLDLPLLAPGLMIPAGVALWDLALDVAGLEITGELPAGVKGAPLVASQELWEHPWRALGFPQGHDLGAWADGLVRGRNAAGLLQIESSRGTGYMVQPGFSGAPVWDSQLGGVIGMITLADLTPGVRAAFILPADLLIRTWPGLELEPRGVLSNVPQVPLNYLHRPAALQTLKTLLLSPQTNPVALTGMGGIGKSVLAAALARDPELRRAFPDGVYWLSLGQNPALTVRQAQLARSLGGGPGQFFDPQEGQAHLQELFRGKRRLLILDDLWQAEHALAFNVLGPESRLLVTTRIPGLVTALEAREQALDPLDRAEALALLAHWADRPVEDLPPEAATVVRLCGHLPLALAMVGASVRGRPERWARALHRLARADLDKIAPQFPYPHPTLQRALAVSVEALSPADRQRYLELAIFPKGHPIPEATLRTCWEPVGLDRFDVEDLLDRLVDRSLLRREASGELGLHDLQHDYLHNQCEKLPALHQRLLAAYRTQCPHGWPSGPDDHYFFQHLAHHLRGAGWIEELHQLLTASPDWMERKFAASSGDAATLADLALALEAFSDPLPAQRLPALAELHAARQVLHRRAGRYSDLDLETLVWLGREAEAAGHARLRSAPRDRVEGLLLIGRVLQQRDAGPSQLRLLREALEKARAVSDPEGRANLLARVALSQFQAGLAGEAQVSLDQALHSACQTSSQSRRDLLLISIAEDLVRAGRLPQAEMALAQVQSAIEPLLQVQLMAQSFGPALESADQIPSSTRWAAALRDIALAQVAANLTREAIETARTIPPDLAPVQAASALGAAAVSLAQAGRLEEAAQLLEEALTIAQATPADWGGKERVDALLAVARAQSAAGLLAGARETLAQAHQAILELALDSNRVAALSALAAAQAAAGLHQEASRTVQEIDSPGRNTVTLRWICSEQVDAGQLDHALETANAIEDPAFRAAALGRVARAHAQAGDLDRWLAIVQSIPQPALQAGELQAMIALQIEAGRSDWAAGLLPPLRDLICRIEEPGIQASQFSQMALLEARLAQPGAAATLDQALTLRRRPSPDQDEFARALLLTYLVRLLARAGRESAPALAEAERIAAGLQTPWMKQELLGRLAWTQAALGHHRAARESALLIASLGADPRPLLELAQLQARQNLVQETRDTVELIDPEYATTRAAALVALARAQAEAGAVQEALETSRSIAFQRDIGLRSQALIAVAQVWARTAAGREKAAAILQEAQTAAEGIYFGEDAPERAAALIGVARAQAQLDLSGPAQETLEEARLTTLAIPYPAQQVETLAEIALLQPALAQDPAPTLGQARVIVQERVHPFEHPRLLALLARTTSLTGDPAGAADLLAQASQRALENERPGVRAEELLKLAPVLAELDLEPELENLLQQVGQIIKEIPTRWESQDALSSLVRVQADLGRFGPALDTVRRFPPDAQGEDRAAARFYLGSAQAAAGLLVGALATLGRREPDEFARILAEWLATGERLDLPAALEALLGAVRIVGWTLPGWGELHQVLAADPAVQSLLVLPSSP